MTAVSNTEPGKPDRVNYRAGANIAGFVKVADAMLSYGHVMNPPVCGLHGHCSLISASVMASERSESSPITDGSA